MSMPMLGGPAGPMPPMGPGAGLPSGLMPPKGPPAPAKKKKTPAGAKNEALAARLSKGGGKK